MTLRRFRFALLAAAAAAAFALPAQADQTFWTYSSGQAPRPHATPNNSSVSIDYVAYPCTTDMTPSDGRFNPWDPRGPGYSPGSVPRPGPGNGFGCWNPGNHHRRPGPPHRLRPMTAPEPRPT